MKISIITVNLNNAIGLAATILSVSTQSVAVEYVVIDGGSQDYSVDLVRQHQHCITHWVSEPDSGIYNAMNKGIRVATGDYLMFLNSGDTLAASDIIEQCQRVLQAQSEVDVLYGNFILESSTGPIAQPLRRQHQQVSIIRLKQATLNHQAALFRAKLFSEFGPYPERFSIAADYWLFLVSLLQGKVFRYIDLVIAGYNVDGVSSLNYQRYAAEMALIWEQYAPGPIKQLVQENEELRRIASFRFVRYATMANELLQTLKQKLSPSKKAN